MFQVVKCILAECTDKHQRQAPHLVMQAGLDYRFDVGEVRDETALLFGLGVRPHDAFFPYVALEWQASRWALATIG